MSKILLVSDSPYATTGLGRMSKYFLKMLPEHEWIVWGFLHPEFHVKKGVSKAMYDEKDFPGKFRIISPQTFTTDQYGLEVIPEIIKREKPQYLLTSMDYNRIVPLLPQIQQFQMTMGLKWINYFPMDREDYVDKEVDSLRYPDVNVCITKFGQDKIKTINPKVDVKQIWHPIDANEFPKIPKKEVKKFKQDTWPQTNNKTFLIGTVNRSFARKDTPRLVTAMGKYLPTVDNTYMYFHGSSTTFEGINLAKLAFEKGAPPGKLAFLPDHIKEWDGLPDDVMNKLYRAFDLFVTVSTGEGYGYSTVEALLTETPFIGPYNTSFPELVQDFGYLIKPGGMTFHFNGTTSMWPFVHVDDVVEQIKYVRENYAEAKEKAKRGSQWVKENLNLKVIGDQWREILK